MFSILRQLTLFSSVHSPALVNPLSVVTLDFLFFLFKLGIFFLPDPQTAPVLPFPILCEIVATPFCDAKNVQNPLQSNFSFLIPSPQAPCPPNDLPLSFRRAFPLPHNPLTPPVTPPRRASFLARFPTTPEVMLDFFWIPDSTLNSSPFPVLTFTPRNFLTGRLVPNPHFFLPFPGQPPEVIMANLRFSLSLPDNPFLCRPNLSQRPPPSPNFGFPLLGEAGQKNVRETPPFRWLSLPQTGGRAPLLLWATPPTNFFFFLPLPLLKS